MDLEERIDLVVFVLETDSFDSLKIDEIGSVDSLEIDLVVKEKYLVDFGLGIGEGQMDIESFVVGLVALH